MNFLLITEIKEKKWIFTNTEDLKEMIFYYDWRLKKRNEFFY